MTTVGLSNPADLPMNPAGGGRVAPADTVHTHGSISVTIDGRSTAHAVLGALNDPITGPRVKKSYSENTRPRDFVIDTAGLTDMTTLSAVMDTVEARPSTES